MSKFGLFNLFGPGNPGLYIYESLIDAQWSIKEQLRDDCHLRYSLKRWCEKNQLIYLFAKDLGQEIV